MASLLKSLTDPADSAFIAGLARGSPMTIVVVDETHTIALVEGGLLLDALGYPWPNDVIGKTVEEIFLPPDKREAHKGWFEAWLNHPEERALRDAQPMVVQKNGDGTIRVRISIKKLYLPDGGEIGEQHAGKPFRGGVAYVFVDT